MSDSTDSNPCIRASMGYVARMTTTPETERSAGPEEKVYVIRATPGDGPMDPEPGAALDDVRKAAVRGSEPPTHNPEKKRKDLEGMGKLLAELQEENGAFTEEELARARASMYGP